MRTQTYWSLFLVSNEKVCKNPTILITKKDALNVFTLTDKKITTDRIFSIQAGVCNIQLQFSALLLVSCVIWHKPLCCPSTALKNVQWSGLTFQKDDQFHMVLRYTGPERSEQVSGFYPLIAHRDRLTSYLSCVHCNSFSGCSSISILLK